MGAELSEQKVAKSPCGGMSQTILIFSNFCDGNGEQVRIKGSFGSEGRGS